MDGYEIQVETHVSKENPYGEWQDHISKETVTVGRFSYVKWAEYISRSSDITASPILIFSPNPNLEGTYAVTPRADEDCSNLKEFFRYAKNQTVKNHFPNPEAQVQCGTIMLVWMNPICVSMVVLPSNLQDSIQD